jgi:hypothetical protein
MSVILIVVITAADLRLAGSYEEQQLPAVNTADQQLLIRAIQAVSGIVKEEKAWVFWRNDPVYHAFIQ